MVKCGVLFEVQTEFLNVIWRSFGFKSVLKQILRWFPNSKLVLHASLAALPILNSSKLPPVVVAADLIVFQISIKQSEIQNSSVCLKPPPVTTTSSLSHYSYQKDERA
jgi:hypothetical protein